MTEITLRKCECQSPEFARMHPVCMTDRGREMLEANRNLIGQVFCYTCGGVPAGEFEMSAHVTGETVIRRLIELGVVPDVGAEIP